uniref:Uncharacterized protein n=1 Tax=Nothobranchius furzeri TaxID=105023 RepID=A0A8C6NLA9_NOTFU
CNITNMLFVLAVLFSLFMEAEANYERLRIGGLIFTGLLIAGGVGTLLCECYSLKKIE